MTLRNVLPFFCRWQPFQLHYRRVHWGGGLEKNVGGFSPSAHYLAPPLDNIVSNSVCIHAPHLNAHLQFSLKLKTSATIYGSGSMFWSYHACLLNMSLNIAFQLFPRKKYFLPFPQRNRKLNDNALMSDQRTYNYYSYKSLLNYYKSMNQSINHKSNHKR